MNIGIPRKASLNSGSGFTCGVEILTSGDIKSTSNMKLVWAGFDDRSSNRRRTRVYSPEEVFVRATCC
jgi:hypothetical protein